MDRRAGATESNGRRGGGNYRNKYGALLKGLVRCASCDVGMVHTYTQKTPNKLYRYYVCVNAHQRGWNTCPTRSVSAPAIEHAVVDQIRGIGASPAMIEAVVGELEEDHLAQQADLEQEKRVAERELRRINQEIAAVIRPVAAQGPGMRLATDRLADLQDRASALQRRMVRSKSARGEGLRGRGPRARGEGASGLRSRMAADDAPRTGEVGEVAGAQRHVRRHDRHERIVEVHCSLKRPRGRRPTPSAPTVPSWTRWHCGHASAHHPHHRGLMLEHAIANTEATDFADFARLTATTRERVAEVVEVIRLLRRIQDEYYIFRPVRRPQRAITVPEVEAIAEEVLWDDQPGGPRAS